MRAHHHAIVLLSLTVGVLLFHGPSIRDAEPRVDEQIYEAAIAKAADGASPYEEGGFFYPPTFARAGVALRATLGQEGARHVLRVANVLGLIYLLWFTIVLGLGREPRKGRGDIEARSPPSPPTWLLILLPCALTLLPGVRLGLSTGNFSFLVGALAIVAIWNVASHPLVSGLLLGTTLLVKPIMAGALPLLMLPVPTSRGFGWSERLARARLCAVAIATGFAGLFLWFDRHELPTMFAAELSGVPRGRSLSIYRFARELGLGELRMPLFVIVVLLLGLALWKRVGGRRDLLAACTLAVPMTTLVVWSHTLVMCLPLAALAISRWRARRHDAGLRGLGEPRDRLEAVLVIGAAVLLAFAHPGGFGDQPGIVQALLLAPFLAAPIVLASFWFRHAPQPDSHASSSDPSLE